MMSFAPMKVAVLALAVSATLAGPAAAQFRVWGLGMAVDDVPSAVRTFEKTSNLAEIGAIPVGETGEPSDDQMTTR